MFSEGPVVTNDLSPTNTLSLEHPDYQGHGLHSGFSQTHNISNNANIGMRGFTT